MNTQHVKALMVLLSASIALGFTGASQSEGHQEGNNQHKAAPHGGGQNRNNNHPDYGYHNNRDYRGNGGYDGGASFGFGLLSGAILGGAIADPSYPYYYRSYPAPYPSYPAP